MRTRRDNKEQDARYLPRGRRHGGAIERLAIGYEAEPSFATSSSRRSMSRCGAASPAYRRPLLGADLGLPGGAQRAPPTMSGRRRRAARRSGGRPRRSGRTLADADDPESPAGERSLLDRLTALLQRLKPADRQVMLLYLEDLGAAEIGEVTGLSAGAVAVRIHRIKALLARQFAMKETS